MKDQDPQAWNSKHKLEALVYLLSLARADVLGRDDIEDVDPSGYLVLPSQVETEDAFCVALTEYESEPSRAVQYVRDLADGRRVRDVVAHRRVVYSDGSYQGSFTTAELAQSYIDACIHVGSRPKVKVVRLIRTRRVDR